SSSRKFEAISPATSEVGPLISVSLGIAGRWRNQTSVLQMEEVRELRETTRRAFYTATRADRATWVWLST
ncbi:hypothetical protein, partial [Burkholderia cepacia]|uniref:hypothetical protein n=1 Tax=Burkholderia cepacia TaxID=292 RepID=UPI001C71B9F2